MQILKVFEPRTTAAMHPIYHKAALTIIEPTFKKEARPKTGIQNRTYHKNNLNNMDPDQIKTQMLHCFLLTTLQRPWQAPFRKRRKTSSLRFSSQDLRPFPTHIAVSYEGHSGMIRVVAVEEPCAKWSGVQPCHRECFRFDNVRFEEGRSDAVWFTRLYESMSCC